MSQRPCATAQELSVSFVIPVKRDDRVVATIQRLRAWAEARDIVLEVVVVGELGASRLPDGVVWIEHRPARKGRCIQIGVCAAHGDYVLVADADLPALDPQLDAVVGALSDCDVVFGNRWTHAVKSMRYEGSVRTVASWTFAFLVRRLFDTPEVDTQCGLKAFRRTVVTRVFERRLLDGFASDVETVVRARIANLRVTNVHVDWTAQSGTTLSMWRAVPEMMVDLLRLKLLLRLRLL
jgi:dolichyl-phosphate beta-glucosyltransferase